jgi:hypothetical protein
MADLSLAHPVTRPLSMPPETFVAFLVIGLLGALGLFLVVDEFRLRKIRAARRADDLFRCEGCGLVYTDDPGEERSRCPQCGRTNTAIGF